MDRISGQNNRNESQIEFVSDPVTHHDSAADFYAAVIRLLWDGWDSAENTEKHIRTAVPTSRSLAELKRKVAENLDITPIPSFTPDLTGPTDILSFRDEWNAQEFVWVSNDQYHYMEWGTSA